MLDIIINFLKSLFIKDKEEPTMEALHNISIPMDTIPKWRNKKCQSLMRL